MPFLQLKNVGYSYPSGEGDSIRAVENVSFSIERGEFVALVGCNGSGKSTVARLCNGLLLPDDGEVTVDGVSTLDKNGIIDIRKKIGIVFQNPDNQTVTAIVEDDIAFGPENLGLPPCEIRKRVDFALESVGMSEYAARETYRLSGGQKQRIAIAGVLAIKPDLIILDEATGMLDPAGRRDVLNVVKKLNHNEHTAVVMITHFMEEAADADRIIILEKGRVVSDGGTELFKKPELFLNAGLELPLFVRVAQKLKAAGIDIGCPSSREMFIEYAVEALRTKGGRV